MSKKNKIAKTNSEPVSTPKTSIITKVQLGPKDESFRLNAIKALRTAGLPMFVVKRGDLKNWANSSDKKPCEIMGKKLVPPSEENRHSWIPSGIVKNTAYKFNAVGAPALITLVGPEGTETQRHAAIKKALAEYNDKYGKSAGQDKPVVAKKAAASSKKPVVAKKAAKKAAPVPPTEVTEQPVSATV